MFQFRTDRERSVTLHFGNELVDETFALRPNTLLQFYYRALRRKKKEVLRVQSRLCVKVASLRLNVSLRSFSRSYVLTRVSFTFIMFPRGDSKTCA